MKVSHKLKAAVVGASGYAGEELVRLLLRHPSVDLRAVTSRQYAGQTLAEVYPGLAHQAQARALTFVNPKADEIGEGMDLVFLAVPHGVAAQYAVPLVGKEIPVIDLSADFRLNDPEVYREYYGQAHPAPELLARFCYGLPEVYRGEIRSARFVACAGCYPTTILVPLIPLLRAGLIDGAGIIANAMSGVTGAGRKTEVDYLFAECNESLRAYGIPKHRHLSEMEQELSLAAGEAVRMQFTPHLVPVNRGILATVYVRPLEPVAEGEGKRLEAELERCYEQAYGAEPFVRLLRGKRLPDTKHVVGTNFIDLAWRVDRRTGGIVVVSAEDNIVKGTSGQAVQCMNLMFGFEETAGLL